MDPLPDLFKGQRYILDLSAIPELPRLRRDLPQGFLLVSDATDQVLTGATAGDGPSMLQQLVRYSEDATDGAPGTLIGAAEYAAIVAAYRALRAAGVISVISNEPPAPDLSSVMAQLVAVDGPDVAGRLADGSHITTKGLFARHLSTILSYSRRTGAAILSRGRGLVNRVTSWINGLELPRKADDVLKKKAAFTERLYAKPGGRAAKFFVGVVIDVTGVFVPAAGVVGKVLYRFVDP